MIMALMMGKMIMSGLLCDTVELFELGTRRNLDARFPRIQCFLSANTFL